MDPKKGNCIAALVILIFVIFPIGVVIPAIGSSSSDTRETGKRIEQTQTPTKATEPSRTAEPTMTPEPTQEVKETATPTPTVLKTKVVEEADTPAPTSSGSVVKKSTSNICHAPGTTYYDRTKNFTPYQSIDACLESGGRLPAR